jgi:hypothetical protein
VAILVLRQIGHWYQRQQALGHSKAKRKAVEYVALPRNKVTFLSSTAGKRCRHVFFCLKTLEFIFDRIFMEGGTLRHSFV